MIYVLKYKLGEKVFNNKRVKSLNGGDNDVSAPLGIPHS
jgi:hypothetical protein